MLSMHLYEVRPRKDHRGVDLISDALLFGRLWYGEPNAVSSAIGYAKFYSRSHDAVIRVYDEAGNVIETHEHATRASRRFEFQKRCQFFIRTHNVTLSVAPMCVCIPSILFKQFLQLLV